MTPSPKQPVLPGAAKELAALTFGVVAVGVYLLQYVIGFGRPEAIVFGVIAGIIFGGMMLLYCYIYADARRRNMKAPLWTALAVIAPSGIGIILYFLLREPLAAYCTQCGSASQTGFAYCPRCGASLNAACPQCHRVPQPGWIHCAACGAKL
jgi:hypothetical protein